MGWGRGMKQVTQEMGFTSTRHVRAVGILPGQEQFLGGASQSEPFQEPLLSLASPKTSPLWGREGKHHVHTCLWLVHSSHESRTLV